MGSASTKDNTMDELTTYLFRFLEKRWPFDPLGPLYSGPIRAADVYDYGDIRSLVLDREPPFQTEFFLVKPGAGFPLEHRHPHVDSFECHVWGQIYLTINGRPSQPRRIEYPDTTGQNRPYIWA